MQIVWKVRGENLPRAMGRGRISRVEPPRSAGVYLKRQPAASD